MAGEIYTSIVGNLTADPELRRTQNGIAVANFTIANTPRTFDRQSNEWKDGETSFIRASIWREPAEHVAASLSKGTRVVATGVLKQRNYETKEGEQRSTVELEIDAIGPELRYATAVVTRANGNRDGVGVDHTQQDPTWGGIEQNPQSQGGWGQARVPGAPDERMPF